MVIMKLLIEPAIERSKEVDKYAKFRIRIKTVALLK